MYNIHVQVHVSTCTCIFKDINQARQGSSQGENGGKRVHMYVYKVSASNTNAYGYSVKHSRRAHTCTHLPRSGISDLAVCSTSFSRFRLSDRDRRRPGHGRRACRVERDATERHRTESKHKQTRDVTRRPGRARRACRAARDATECRRTESKHTNT